jgi:hypothetical protein
MANIPSPIAGVGNSGNRPGWPEQLLLTLAAQGPGLLMQWLEHRQQNAQMGANDDAAKAAMMALPNMSNIEQAAVRAAGGNPGMPPTTVQGQTTPSGLKTPTITAGGMPADYSGLQAGVAPKLLEMLQGIRTSETQRAMNESGTAVNVAQAGAITGREEREQKLFPLERERIKTGIRRDEAAIRASEASIRSSDAQAEQTEEETSFLKATRTYRERLARAQALEAEGRREAATAENVLAQRELRTWASDRAAADMQRIAEQTKALAATFPGVTDPRALQGMAANMILGVPAMPTRGDLLKFYEQFAAGDGSVDIDAMMRDRVLQTYKLTIEDKAGLDNALAQSAGDAAKAIRMLEKRGFSAEQMAQAAGYYTAVTNKPVELPEEHKVAIQTIFDRFIIKPSDDLMTNIGSTMINIGTLGSFGGMLEEIEGREGVWKNLPAKKSAKK